MSYQWECSNDLAVCVPCPDCPAGVGDRCRTRGGNVAKAQHAARRDPFMKAWVEGYLSCEDDYKWSGGPSERVLALDMGWNPVVG